MKLDAKMAKYKGCTKSEIIAEFIRVNEPTRTELTRFIVVNLNGKATTEEFDKNRAHWRGYYAMNITNWKYNGKLEVKGKRYRLTKYYVRDGKLYSVAPEIRIKQLENSIENNGKDALKLISDLKEIANNWRALAVQRKALLDVKDIDIKNHKNALRLKTESNNRLSTEIDELNQKLEAIKDIVN